jgi:hypothetical protein
MLSGRFWFSTMFEPPPPPPVFFLPPPPVFFLPPPPPPLGIFLLPIPCTPQCRYGYARPFTLRRHLRITLFSRTFTTQSSLTTSIRSRSPSQVVGQEP